MRFQSAVVFLSLCAGSLSASIVNAEGRIEESLDKRSPQIISPAAPQQQPSVNVNAPQAPQPFAAQPFIAPAAAADNKPDVVAINQPSTQPAVAAPLAAAPVLGNRPQSQTVNSPA